MKKQLKLSEHMEGLRIFNILNSIHSCELDDRDCIFKNAHRPGFQRPVFGRDYEIFEGILEMKSRIHMVLFHNYQKTLNDLVLSEKRLPSGTRLSLLDQCLKHNSMEYEIELYSVEEVYQMQRHQESVRVNEREGALGYE